MATIGEHPRLDQLRCFAQGRLSVAELHQIEAHLAECPECCAAIEQFPEDPIVHALRNSAPTIALSASTTRPHPIHPFAPKIAGYEFHDVLGTGGMGVVYRARHIALNRWVAVKIVRDPLAASPDLLARFRDEARTLAMLNHPNIVMVFDAGWVEGVPYIVLEFVDGDSLANRVEKLGPMSEAEAIRCIAEAARGLAFAHQHGIIHRDVKPGNLLLSKANELKVADLGLARFLESPTARRDGKTAHMTLLGSLDYLAPEQALDGRAVDARTDVYSLGCTLFFLLNGRPPYPSQSLLQSVVAHREHPIPSIGSKRLQPIFARMVAKSPDDRFGSMGELLAELCPDRRRRWTGMVLSVSILLIVGLLVLWLPTRRASPTISAEPQPPDSPASADAPFSADEAKAHQRRWAVHLKTEPIITNSLQMHLALIPPGRYLRGRSADQLAAARLNNQLLTWGGKQLLEMLPAESPQHPVRITRPFFMGVHEVTIGQFDEFIQATRHVTEAEKHPLGGVSFSEELYRKQRREWNWRTPGWTTSDDHPVSQVSHADALAFCAWLSQREGVEYRLPTEAEWEFACRAGTSTAWYFGDQYVEYPIIGARGNRYGPQAVGLIPPNPFGLHDLYGNVGERCQDWFATDAYVQSPLDDPQGPPTGKVRVHRGCSFVDQPRGVDSATRFAYLDDWSDRAGFRVVRVISP